MAPSALIKLIQFTALGCIAVSASAASIQCTQATPQATTFNCYTGQAPVTVPSGFVCYCRCNNAAGEWNMPKAQVATASACTASLCSTFTGNDNLPCTLANGTSTWPSGTQTMPVLTNQAFATAQSNSIGSTTPTTGGCTYFDWTCPTSPINTCGAWFNGWTIRNLATTLNPTMCSGTNSTLSAGSVYNVCNTALCNWSPSSGPSSTPPITPTPTPTPPTVPAPPSKPAPPTPPPKNGAISVGPLRVYAHLVAAVALFVAGAAAATATI